MQDISITIITYNEERNIQRCLNSIIDLSEDIVVVDSFSTDDTREICKDYPNVRVITHEFEGHVEQKNYALAYVKNDYVLSLDADEFLSETLKDSIKSALQDVRYDGYYFNRLTNFCGKWIKHSGWYPDRKIRLWNINKGKWGGVNPHDKVIMKSGIKISYLKGDLLHYSFNSISEHITQINKFSDIRAEEMLKSGKTITILNYILSPVVKFIKQYFFKLGFLDGLYGFIISVNSAHSTFLKYTKLRELRQESPPQH